jgi:hypothetical protein
MKKENQSKKDVKPPSGNSESQSSGRRKITTNQIDSTEDQHGKGGSGKKSNEDSQGQDANRQGFGEDE